MKTIAIFQKEMSTKDGKQRFTVFSTKNKKGEYCKVKFLDDALDFVKDNITDKKPFVVEVENNKISYRERTKVIVEEVNDIPEPKTVTERTFFIDEIVSIQEYVREEIDENII